MDGVRFRAAISRTLDADLLPVAETDTISGIRARALKGSIFKKFVATSLEAERLDVEAQDRFLATCQRIKTHWIGKDQDTRLLRYMRAEFAYSVQNYDWTLFQCLSYGRTGPGSSVGCSVKTDFFTKMFNSSLSYTDDILLKYYNLVITDTWYSGELVRARHHGSKQVEGSTISSVPKDDQKRRTICTEPTLNMFYQLGLKEIFERVLRDVHNLDVSKQPLINIDLARRGSIDGSFATIDLSDASDSISLELVKALLPRDLYNLVMLLRSSKAKVKGAYVDLPMVSTMGNGFTFALMTLIFSCLVRSVYNMHGIHPKCGRNYTVFGDDIIVVSDMYPHIISALEDLGFIPNVNKSFADGPFRESCGGDFHLGFDVRGVYLKELQNDADLNSSFNRLARWSDKSGISLGKTLNEILTFYEDKIFVVPGDESDNAGLKIPSDQLSVLNPSIFVLPKTTTSGGWRYKALRPKALRYRTGLKYNEDGALTAFIGGYIRRGCIIGRSVKTTEYKVTRLFTPSWDRTKVTKYMPKQFGRRHWFEITSELSECILDSFSIEPITQLVVPKDSR